MARRKLLRRRHVPKNKPVIGAIPGELIAHSDAHTTQIRVIAYGPEKITDEVVTTIDEISALRTQHPHIWVDLVGFADLELLKAVGDLFGLHPLALEDMVELGQRPKAVEYGEQTLIVMRQVWEGDLEQLSIAVGAGFVLTIQEKPGDPWEPVRRRLHGSRGRVRKAGPDYLAYALVDTAIDQYYPLFDEVGLELEALETRIYAGEDVVPDLARVRHTLTGLRRILWPTRDALASLCRGEIPAAFQPETMPYLRDGLDHAARLVEIGDSLRESAGTLMDTHVALSSQRLGESMGVLTTIATIFMPLSFLVGMYGMNFDRASPWNMPELGWKYGYPALICVMLMVAGGLILYFRKRKWL